MNKKFYTFLKKNLQKIAEEHPQKKLKKPILPEIKSRLKNRNMLKDSTHFDNMPEKE